MTRKGKEKRCSCVRLDKKHLDFVDKLSKCCKYSGGKNLSRSEIIYALICISKNIKINIAKIKSEEELTKRVMDAFTRKG